MLSGVEDAKRAGVSIVSVNPPLPRRPASVQEPTATQRPVGRVVPPSATSSCRSGQWRSRAVPALGRKLLDAEDTALGTALDRDFIATHTPCVSTTPPLPAGARLGRRARVDRLAVRAIDELVERVLRSQQIIVCGRWA